jgi:hypothetical protein
MEVMMNTNRIVGGLVLEDIYIQQAFDYYRERYQQNELAQKFVLESSEIPVDLKSSALIGLCDRTLGLHFPQAKTLEGGAIRGHFRRAGLFKETGVELFRGYVVFPVMNDNCMYESAVGYRFGRVRDNQKSVIYWAKPEPKALINEGIQQLKEFAHAKAFH